MIKEIMTCDKCNRLIKDGEEFYTFTNRWYNRGLTKHEDSFICSGRYDFCKECLKEFMLGKRKNQGNL